MVGNVAGNRLQSPRHITNPSPSSKPSYPDDASTDSSRSFSSLDDPFATDPTTHNQKRNQPHPPTTVGGSSSESNNPRFIVGFQKPLAVTEKNSYTLNVDLSKEKSTTPDGTLDPNVGKRVGRGRHNRRPSSPESVKGRPSAYVDYGTQTTPQNNGSRPRVDSGASSVYMDGHRFVEPLGGDYRWDFSSSPRSFTGAPPLVRPEPRRVGINGVGRSYPLDGRVRLTNFGTDWTSEVEKKGSTKRKIETTFARVQQEVFNRNAGLLGDDNSRLGMKISLKYKTIQVFKDGKVVKTIDLTKDERYEHILGEVNDMENTLINDDIIYATSRNKDNHHLPQNHHFGMIGSPNGKNLSLPGTYTQQHYRFGIRKLPYTHHFAFKGMGPRPRLPQAGAGSFAGLGPTHGSQFTGLNQGKARIQQELTRYINGKARKITELSTERENTQIPAFITQIDKEIGKHSREYRSAQAKLRELNEIPEERLRYIAEVRQEAEKLIGQYVGAIQSKDAYMNIQQAVADDLQQQVKAGLISANTQFLSKEGSYKRKNEEAELGRIATVIVATAVFAKGKDVPQRSEKADYTFGLKKFLQRNDMDTNSHLGAEGALFQMMHEGIPSAENEMRRDQFSTDHMAIFGRDYSNYFQRGLNLTDDRVEQRRSKSSLSLPLVDGRSISRAIPSIGGLQEEQLREALMATPSYLELPNKSMLQEDTFALINDLVSSNPKDPWVEILKTKLKSNRSSTIDGVKDWLKIVENVSGKYTILGNMYIDYLKNPSSDTPSSPSSRVSESHTYNSSPPPYVDTFEEPDNGSFSSFPPPPPLSPSPSVRSRSAEESLIDFERMLAQLPDESDSQRAFDDRSEVASFESLNLSQMGDSNPKEPDFAEVVEATSISEVSPEVRINEIFSKLEDEMKKFLKLQGKMKKKDTTTNLYQLPQLRRRISNIAQIRGHFEANAAFTTSNREYDSVVEYARTLKSKYSKADIAIALFADRDQEVESYMLEEQASEADEDLRDAFSKVLKSEEEIVVHV